MPRKPFETAVLDFTQAVGLLVRRARAASASDELSFTQSAVMGRIANYGPATIAELARGEAMKPQSMGTTIASLEQMGMVERKPHSTDGRQALIGLTANGATARKAAREAKRTWMAEAIGQLDKGEQATLFAAGEIIKRLVEL